MLFYPVHTSCLAECPYAGLPFWWGALGVLQVYQTNKLMFLIITIYHTQFVGSHTIEYDVDLRLVIK